jgi:hypothetical protein
MVRLTPNGGTNRTKAEHYLYAYPYIDTSRQQKERKEALVNLSSWTLLVFALADLWLILLRSFPYLSKIMKVSPMAWWRLEAGGSRSVSLTPPSKSVRTAISWDSLPQRESCSCHHASWGGTRKWILEGYPLISGGSPTVRPLTLASSSLTRVAAFPQGPCLVVVLQKMA